MIVQNLTVQYGQWLCFLCCYVVCELEKTICPLPRSGARGGHCPPKFCLTPKKSSGLFLKVLHRPLTAPLVAKLAPPVASQMKMSGSAPASTPFKIYTEFNKKCACTNETAERHLCNERLGVGLLC